MRKLTEPIIYILSCLQIIFPALAFLYLLNWCLRVMNESWFVAIDKYIGLIPGLIDVVLKQTVYISGEELPTGYIYTSALFIIITLINTAIIEQIKNARQKIEFLKVTKEMRKDADIKKSKKEIRAKNIRSISKFYGLIELKFILKDGCLKTNEEVKEIKIELSKMLARKIQAKYPEIKFAVSDKIFLLSEQFETINTLVNDVVVIFKLLSKLNEEQNITTELLFSIWSNWKEVENKKVVAILDSINKLNFANKVIVSSEIKERYEYSKEINFSFNPLGASKLFLGKNYNNEDVDVDLFYLKSFKQ